MLSKVGFLVSFLFVESCGVHQQGPSPTDPRKLWLDETRAQAAPIKYDSLLDRVMGRDTSALRHLFQLHLDGAGADGHSQVLWSLLWNWGDRNFAAVLRPQPDSTRSRVICSLDYAADSSYERQFPVTFALASHVSTCRDW